MTIQLRTLFILITLLTAFCSSAQLRYGFRLGGSFADAALTQSPDRSLRNGSGFSGGMMLEWQMETNGFAPDIAVLYTHYNFGVTDRSDNRPVTTPKDYIEVPLHLKYKFYLSRTNNLVAPMIYTGPAVLFRTESKILQMKRVIPGWDLGLGLDIVNFIQLTAGYRFGIGNSMCGTSASGAHPHLRTNGWHVAANIIFDF